MLSSTESGSRKRVCNEIQMLMIEVKAGIEEGSFYSPGTNQNGGMES
jgi:hypothetical protein